MVYASSIKAGDDDKDKCPKCGGKVFEAERVSSGKYAYHRLCFTCSECFRGLDSFSSCTGPNQQLVCSSCYNKLYDPIMRNYNQENSMKLMQSMYVESKDQKSGCFRYIKIMKLVFSALIFLFIFRCHGTVYPTEGVSTNGYTYHKVNNGYSY